MTLPFLGEQYLPHWDGYTEYLDESLGGLDFDAANWLASGNMNTVYGLLASSTSGSSPDKSSEYSPDFPPPSTQKVETLKPRKKSKGRPKIDPDNAQSATERRRKQVRLAQQAYRHRKEATVASLKKDNEDLKDRLANVNLAFDQLLGTTLKVATSLSSQEFDTIHTLCKRVEEYRLPPVATTGENGNEGLRSEECERNPPVNSFADESSSSLMSSVTTSNTQRVVGTSYTNELSQPRLPYVQGPSTNLFDVAPRIETTLLLQSPPISSFWQLPPGPIPFSLRFRHEALRRGYSLITAQETTFSALCRAFKYCIFSDSREGIIRRVQYLLHQSTKFMYQTFATTDLTTINSSEPVHPEHFKKSLQLLDSPSHFSLDSTTYYLPSDFGSENSETLLDSVERYIDAEGVEQYLLDRGLKVSAGSNYVTIPRSRVLQNTMNPTLFDEIRAGQELKLSVNKLMHELLERIVCLDLGPGIQALEIDEAIRSTMLASV